MTSELVTVELLTARCVRLVGLKLLAV